MIKKELISKFNSLLASSKQILVLSHKSPDGDAVGVMLAAGRMLEELGKRVDLVFSERLASSYNFLKGIEKLSSEMPESDPDLILILDCGNPKRTGFFESHPEIFSGRIPMVVIDHHISEANFDFPKNSLKITNFEASSTSEIMYDVICASGFLIDKEIAMSLLTGIYFDTGSFQHSNTSERTLKIASELVARGARVSKISKHLFNTKNVSSLRLWGRVLLRIRQDRRFGIVTSIVTLKDLIECEATIEDLGDVVNLINSIPGARASILLSEREKEEIKGSIRVGADGDVDATRLAAIFGGGGHVKAAGFSVKGRFEEDSSGWKVVR